MTMKKYIYLSVVILGCTCQAMTSSPSAFLPVTQGEVDGLFEKVKIADGITSLDAIRKFDDPNGNNLNSLFKDAIRNIKETFSLMDAECSHGIDSHLSFQLGIQKLSIMKNFSDLYISIKEKYPDAVANLTPEIKGQLRNLGFVIE
jgi:hypothetical protein